MPSLHSARAGLADRLEERDGQGFSLTAPFTFTTVIGPTQSTTTTTTTTSFNPPPPTTTQQTTTTSFSFTPSLTQTQTQPTLNSPSVSVIPSTDTPSTAADSATSSTRHFPAGAIVGITLGGLILILLALILLLRFRFKHNRQQRRKSWISKPAVPSQAVTGITASSFAPAEKFPETAMMSPSTPFTQAQQQALSKPPNMPGAAGLAPNTAIVKFTFNPALSDELSIVSGEILTIMQEFDDGWALCSNANGEQGMVPLECLERDGSSSSMGGAMGTARDVRNSKRASSLINSPTPLRR